MTASRCDRIVEDEFPADRGRFNGSLADRITVCKTARLRSHNGFIYSFNV
jgi:hypothetical protein